jgi:hypothetical protein
MEIKSELTIDQIKILLDTELRVTELREIARQLGIVNSGVPKITLRNKILLKIKDRSKYEKND